MLRKLKNAVLLLYLVIACGAASGVCVWFFGAWATGRAVVGSHLAREASVVTNFIQGSLIDASKLLDLARIRIVENSERRQINPEAIHQILDATLKSVSFSVSEDIRGLLFFIDPDARMVAQSGAFPAPNIDFSDRLYYRKLIADPSAKVAVGNMLIARTTGQLVFHISMPVRAKGKLLGVLVQQLRVNDVAGVIREYMTEPGAVIVTRLNSDEVAFVFPADATAPVFAGSPCKRGGSGDWFGANADDGQVEALLVGHAFSRAFGLCTSASLSEKAAFAQFLRARSPQLIVLTGAFLLMTALFVALLGLIGRLDDEIELSNHDALTGLRNRRYLDAVFENYCRASIRGGSPLAVLFLDIDHFKDVNDAYGHPAGDEVLKALGGVLQGCVKRPFDVCCRWGGEEFVVLLPDTDIGGALAVAEVIRADIRRLVIRFGGVALPSMTVSIGLVSRALSPETMRDDLVNMADKAMLKAKAQGRNRIVIFDEIDAHAEMSAN